MYRHVRRRYNNMGNVYNSLTHSSLAASAYAWAAAANPNNPDYLCNLAGAVQRQVMPLK